MGSLVGLMPEAMFVGTLSERYPEILPILEAMERETCRRARGLRRHPGSSRQCRGCLYRARLGGIGVRRGERLGVGSARPAPRRRDLRRPS